MATKSCSNLDCKFDEDQQCVEGLNPEECTYRRVRPLIEAEPETDGEDNFDYGDSAPESDGIGIHSGNKLTRDETAGVVLDRSTNLISVIAHRDAGKTSLIASAYEIFLEGRTTQILEGSLTFRAFELACHLSRAASGRIEPDQERTRTAEGVGYYHLDLLNSLIENPMALLLADRPGENFRDAAGNLANAMLLHEVKLADVVAVLVDGDALSTNERRHLPHSQLSGALGAMKEAGLFAHQPRFSFVLTKADVGRRAGIAEDVSQRFKSIVERLTMQLSGCISEAREFVTVASPLDEDHGHRSEGVPELVEYWSEARKPKPQPRIRRTSNRAYGQFGLDANWGASRV